MDDGKDNQSVNSKLSSAVDEGYPDSCPPQEEIRIGAGEHDSRGQGVIGQISRPADNPAHGAEQHYPHEDEHQAANQTDNPFHFRRSQKVGKSKVNKRHERQLDDGMSQGNEDAGVFISEALGYGGSG